MGKAVYVERARVDLRKLSDLVCRGKLCYEQLRAGSNVLALRGIEAVVRKVDGDSTQGELVFRLRDCGTEVVVIEKGKKQITFDPSKCREYAGRIASGLTEAGYEVKYN